MTTKINTAFVVDNRVELLCLLRHTRIQRDRLQTDMLALEERLRAGETAITLPAPAPPIQVVIEQGQPEISESLAATTQSAILALQSDISILDDLIKRMWVSNAS